MAIVLIIIMAAMIQQISVAAWNPFTGCGLAADDMSERTRLAGRHRLNVVGADGLSLNWRNAGWHTVVVGRAGRCRIGANKAGADSFGDRRLEVLLSNDTPYYDKLIPLWWSERPRHSFSFHAQGSFLMPQGCPHGRVWNGWGAAAWLGHFGYTQTWLPLVDGLLTGRELTRLSVTNPASTHKVSVAWRNRASAEEVDARVDWGWLNTNQLRCLTCGKPTRGQTLAHRGPRFEPAKWSWVTTVINVVAEGRSRATSEVTNWKSSVPRKEFDAQFWWLNERVHALRHDAGVLSYPTRDAVLVGPTYNPVNRAVQVMSGKSRSRSDSPAQFISLTLLQQLELPFLWRKEGAAYLGTAYHTLRPRGERRAICGHSSIPANIFSVGRCGGYENPRPMTANARYTAEYTSARKSGSNPDIAPPLPLRAVNTVMLSEHNNRRPLVPITKKKDDEWLFPEVARVVDFGCFVRELPDSWKVIAWADYRRKNELAILAELDRVAAFPAHEVTLTHIRMLLADLRAERKKDWSRWVASGDDYESASKHCGQWLKRVRKLVREAASQ